MNIIFTFRKNRTEHVKAYFQTYRRTNLVHLRVFQTKPDGTEAPTTKGIAVQVNQLGLLHEATQALLEAQEASSQ